MTRSRSILTGVEAFAARTPTLPPATTTNSYAIGDASVLLVEPATPFEDEQAAWLDWARALGASRRIEAIVATHHHPDHVGGARAFAEALGVPVWAHEETARRLDFPVSRRLVEGDVLELGSQRWDVLHTPGHAPGHVCLVERHLRIAVVGDMVASEGTILIDPQEGDLGRYLRELERLACIDLAIALPAHGAPIEEPRQLFNRYVDHRRMRESKVLRAVGLMGAASSRDLLPHAYDDTPTSVWPLAALSLESHLLELERRGRVVHHEGLWQLASAD